MPPLTGHADVNAVRDATDLVALIGEHIALRPKGREHVGLCPFHDDSKPSLAVVTHKGHAFYKCFACGAAGDCFNFVIDYHKMTFGEALRFLAERAGIQLKPRAAESSSGGETPRSEVLRANSAAMMFFQQVLKHDTRGAAAREVLEKRRISAEMVQEFSLGAAPAGWDGLVNALAVRKAAAEPYLAAGLLKKRDDGTGVYDAFRNRVIFPICDERGQAIAFGARAIDPADEPKYLNSAESAVFKKSATLYGLHLAKRSIIDSKQAIITEGYTDVIACHQAGVRNVLGTLGTALTRDHARLLRRWCDSVVLVFDGDEAGQKAADRAIEVLFGEPIDVKICVLPDQLDPDELLKQDGGVERFASAVAGAQDALEYKVARFKIGWQSASGMAGRIARLETFLGELADLGLTSVQGVRRALWIARLSQLLGVTDRDIEKSLPQPRRMAAPRSTEMETPHAAAPETEIDGREVSKARRDAERELLSLLLAQPALAEQTVVSVSGSQDAVCQLHPADRFEDPAANVIAAILYPFLGRAEFPAVQELMTAAGNPQVRSLIASLYLDGERRCGRDLDSAVAELRAASLALEAVIEREAHQHRITQFRATPAPSDPAAHTAVEIIEQRRKQRYNPAALARGLRT